MVVAVTEQHRDVGAAVDIAVAKMTVVGLVKQIRVNFSTWLERCGAVVMSWPCLLRRRLMKSC